MRLAWLAGRSSPISSSSSVMVPSKCLWSCTHDTSRHMNGGTCSFFRQSESLISTASQIFPEKRSRTCFSSTSLPVMLRVASSLNRSSLRSTIHVSATPVSPVEPVMSLKMLFTSFSFRVWWTRKMHMLWLSAICLSEDRSL